MNSCTRTRRPQSIAGELHSDTPRFGLALRAALRQAPKVILVGEMRDRETIETALEAAETGHLVMSTLHTNRYRQDRRTHRGHLPTGRPAGPPSGPAWPSPCSTSFSQRLLPRKDGRGRIAVIEVLKATLRTREYVEQGERDGKTLLDAMRDGAQDGMQHFDGEIERLIRAGDIDLDVGLSYATNSANPRLEIADLLDERRPEIKVKAEPARATGFSSMAINPADILR